MISDVTNQAKSATVSPLLLITRKENESKKSAPGQVEQSPLLTQKLDHKSVLMRSFKNRANLTSTTLERLRPFSSSSEITKQPNAQVKVEVSRNLNKDLDMKFSSTQ